MIPVQAPNHRLMDNSPVYISQPVLALAFIVAYLFSLLLDPRFIHIMGLVTGAGIVLFPLTYVLSSLMAVLYGRNYSIQIIMIACLINLSYVLLTMLVVQLPSPDFNTEYNTAFEKIYQFNLNVFITSTVCYFIAESLNSSLCAWIKCHIKKRAEIFYLLTILSVISLDTVLFIYFAYPHLTPTEMISMWIARWLVKSTVAIIYFIIIYRLYSVRTPIS